MSLLPTGTITFLFADIEGSTRLLEHLGEGYTEVVAEYRRLFRAEFHAYGGQEVDTQGDAFFVAFTQAKDALSAALAAQKSILRHDWPSGMELRVRMGLHTGEPLHTEAGYVGMDVNRAARICASGHGGQILLSQTTADLVESSLPRGVILRDLGAYRLKDLMRPERIFQLLHPDLPADFPHLKSVDAFPNNLPVQLTTFIGREREVTQIKQLLNASRLVTLTGAGGSGKSRLALQVAAGQLSGFPNGVWFVELASLTDPSLVPQAVASVLNVIEQPGRAILARLMDALQQKHLLLVLDNCEHLLEACVNFTDALLRRCRQLRILATSREALGITGERAFQIPTMSLPSQTDLTDLEGLRKSEAIRLFVDRASLVQRDFRITTDNAPRLAHLCQHLDGIPLAIELAAARVKVLSLEEIAARLDDRFRLLVGSRTALPRHRTLEATMDWSHTLLSEKEQLIFRRFSVFVGGFTLEAAEATCSGAGVEAAEVLILLTQLADKSLVIAETFEREARYHLLETVRQYAWGKLLQAGESENIQRRHYDWYLALAEKADSQLTGPEQASWLDRLERDHDNLRAALACSLRDESNSQPVLRLAASLCQFWNRRGHKREGRKWLEEVLSRGTGSPTALWVKANNFRGTFEFVIGGATRAVPLLEESLATARTLGDKRAIAESLYALGSVANETADYLRGTALLEESLESYRQLGDKPEIARGLNGLGAAMLFRGNLDRAVVILDESLVLAREIGYVTVIASSLAFLGRTALNRREYKRATALLEESVALSKKLGDNVRAAFVTLHLANSIWRQTHSQQAVTLVEESLAKLKELEDNEAIAIAKLHLGYLERLQGNTARSKVLLEESLTLSQELGVRWVAGMALKHLGLAACDEGKPEQAVSLIRDALVVQRQVEDKRPFVESLRALGAVASSQMKLHRSARLFGAADSIGDAIDSHSDFFKDLEIVRSKIEPQVFAAIWDEGRAMSLDQALEYALSQED